MNKQENSVIKNMVAILSYQLVVLMCGLLVPKLILESYGASMHGLTSTITNVSQYVMLINTGIVNVAMGALYRPFAENDYDRVNAVVNATRNVNIKMGNLSVFLICLLSVALALIIQKDGISFRVIFLISLVMGMQQILERYLICTYQIIIQSSQRMYVVYFVNTITYIIRSVAQIIMIKKGFSLIFVQAMPAVVMILAWFMLRLYVVKNYPLLDKKVPRDENVLKNRKYALVHTVAGLVVNNSSVLFLTIFCNQIAVSIFSVYNLVIQHLHNVILTVFSRSNLTNIGRIYATESIDALRKKYSQIELTFSIVTSIAYSICFALLIPFVTLYTSGQDAVEYKNYTLCILIVMFGILNGLREPGIMMVDATAYYKKTQYTAIIETILNISLSVLGVIKYGVSGVLIGLVCAFIYRYFDLMRIVNHDILKQSVKNTYRRGFESVVIIVLFYFAVNRYVTGFCTDWLHWFVCAVIISILSALITIISFIITDRQEVLALWENIMSRVRR